MAQNYPLSSFDSFQNLQANLGHQQPQQQGQQQLAGGQQMITNTWRGFQDNFTMQNPGNAGSQPQAVPSQVSHLNFESHSLPEVVREHSTAFAMNILDNFPRAPCGHWGCPFSSDEAC